MLVGSGVTTQNIPKLAPISDALIVGSAAKIDSEWSNNVDGERVEALVSALEKALAP